MGSVATLRPGQRATGIYVRVADDRRGGSAAGRQEQEAACRALCERLGWDVVDVYIDNELTPRGRRSRPQFERLLADMQVRRVTAVAVLHADRIARDPGDVERFLIAADEYNTALASAVGEIDLSQDSGRKTALRMATFARRQAERDAADLGEKHQAAAEHGQVWRQGTRCFGYNADGLTINETEAATVKDLTARLLGGESLRAVTLSLNQAGITTTVGRNWTPTTLKRLLLNPRLTGHRAYRGKLTKAEWPGVLTAKEQRDLTKLLAERAGDTGRRRAAPRRYLLTGGLLVCGLCGAPLQSQPTENGKRGYVCRKAAGSPGCGKIRIAADPIEAEVTERVLARLASPAIRRRLSAALGNDGEQLDKVAEIESQLMELGRDYGDRRIGRTEFLAARDRLADRLERARDDAVAAARVSKLPAPDPESLAAWWTEATLPERRELVALVLDHVTVGPATRRGPVGLDEDRLTWIWRTS